MSLSRLRPLALALLAGGSLACARTPPEPPNLVVIVVDTLRADHLGAYGYAPPTSPTIDGLAERGALFEAAYSTAAYTRPSTASILTGHYPSVHGAVTHADSIGPGIATLAERLQGAGYRTAGFYRNGNVGPRFGFARGFDEYVGVEKRHRRERRRRGEGAGAAEKNSETGDWLVAEAAIPALDAFRKDRAETGRPFFLYLHLADPHDPYTPPRDVLSGFLDGPLLPELELFYTQPRSAMTENPSVLRRLTTGQLPWRPNTLEQIVALYDAEIAASDAVIGRVLGHLESLGLAEETVVVVTSDHGEELFERGNSGHGHSHFEEQLHVPLVIAGAGVERRRIRGPVSLIDLTPTLLELAGLPVDGDGALPGTSLVPTLRGGDEPNRSVYSEGLLRVQNQRDAIFFRTLRDGSAKLTLDFLRHEKRLVDLAADPLEVEPAAELSETGRRLHRQLVERHAANLDSDVLGGAAAVAIDGDTENELRALGYIGGAEDSRATDSLFRRSLRITDTARFGFVGHELDGARYLSSFDFTGEDPLSGARGLEQFLHGWRLQATPFAVRRDAAIRLSRGDHAGWRLGGRIRLASSGLGDRVRLTVTVDGAPARRLELDAGETFELTGELDAEPPSRNRGFTRIDIRCDPVDDVQTDPAAWCFAPSFVGLTPQPSLE